MTIVIFEWSIQCLDIQLAFDRDWANNSITYSGWYENASDSGVVAFKLLAQAGNGGTIERSKVISGVHLLCVSVESTKMMKNASLQINSRIKDRDAQGHNSL